MIKWDRAALDRPTDAGAEVIKTELLWVVHTVALAILNPSKLVSIELVPPARSRRQATEFCANSQGIYRCYKFCGAR
jgi:hypothetical protein